MLSKRLVGELLCRTDLTHISAMESDRVMCREASPFLTGALYNSILHGRREGLLAKRGENDGSTHPSRSDYLLSKDGSGIRRNDGPNRRSATCICTSQRSLAATCAS